MAVDVLCIGHAAYDISLFVDAFPEENSKCETEELLESGGGPAANAAYLLSLWQTSCAFAGLVGDDRHAASLREEFLAVGTDVSLLEMRAGHVTPVSLILINRQNGSRTIVNRKIQQATVQLDSAILNRMCPKVLLFDGHELDASLAALEEYPAAISILDAGSWREGTAKLAARVDFLAASERFALRAAGLPALHSVGDQRDCVRRLREQFGTTTIVTLGENGLVADDGTGFFHVPAFPATAVDTTAAGDIFHGALAYAILQQMPLREGLRFAAMTASLSVRRVGGRTSIPALAQVNEALQHAD